jgi:hypothetical protein
MLEPSRHERDSHPSVVRRHFLMPSFANCKAGAGHVFSNENGETSIVTELWFKVTSNRSRSLCRIALTGKAKAHFRFLEKGIAGKEWEAKGRAAG